VWNFTTAVEQRTGNDTFGRAEIRARPLIDL